MSIVQEDYDVIAAILFRNKENLILRAAYASDLRESASGTVLVECQAGDQVFVSVDYSGRFGGDYMSSSLSGFLIHRLP